MHRLLERQCRIQLALRDHKETRKNWKKWSGNTERSLNGWSVSFRQSKHRLEAGCALATDTAAARERERSMRDLQAHLEKLRIQVTACERNRDLTTDPQRKKLLPDLLSITRFWPLRSNGFLRTNPA